MSLGGTAVTAGLGVDKKEKQFLDHWELGGDLVDFRKSWQFEQLNTFERVLLGQRVEAEHKSIARFCRSSQVIVNCDSKDALGISDESRTIYAAPRR